MHVVDEPSQEAQDLSHSEHLLLSLNFPFGEIIITKIENDWAKIEVGVYSHCCEISKINAFIAIQNNIIWTLFNTIIFV